MTWIGRTMICASSMATITVATSATTVVMAAVLRTGSNCSRISSVEKPM